MPLPAAASLVSNPGLPPVATTLLWPGKTRDTGKGSVLFSVIVHRNPLVHDQRRPGVLKPAGAVGVRKAPDVHAPAFGRADMALPGDEREVGPCYPVHQVVAH